MNSARVALTFNPLEFAYTIVSRNLLKKKKKNVSFMEK